MDAGAENVKHRQALWDIYGILGFDQDGDPTPIALKSDLAKLVVDAAREFRADFDSLEATGDY